ncbi:MAG: SLC13 family permease [Desulfarculaceae bacterium]|nr:SLC13 family permease [Desulfarculaceae bacterium]MCF8047021.1 SLC13 family permease [Desulfarculaceae bacterium]MCF8065214.1 SLC13 family permease [Desulfarculaceae bacterium]MCF8096507.1 SLC13 family permease [Desulfarculaceae bacterium]MCF8121761.1 SLC13 family permease [Desulfarculaceae bacterium]
MPTLTAEMILVMMMIGVAVFLFIVEWVRVDVVAILMMVTLPLLHLVTPSEAFSGLSSNAVVSIIAVIIIGAGLDKTGVVNRLVGPILKVAGNSQSRIVIFISLTVAFISSFMQNIGAAALFLPAVQRISKNLKIPIGKLLMPIGFSAILGGTVTLVGSSPLILLNDLMIPFKLEPFGLFDVTPVGLALVAAGIACFVFFGRFILPGGKAEESSPAAEDRQEENQIIDELGRPWELTTPEDFTHYREPVTVDALRKRYLVNVVGLVEPPDFKVLGPAPDQEIRSGVDMVVYGQEKDVRRMAQEEGMELKEDLALFKGELADHASGTVEAVVAPRSSLAGKTLNQVDLTERFQVTPLAVYRQGVVYRAELGDLPLRVGDAVLLHGTWKRLELLHAEGSLLFTTPLDSDQLRPEKAMFAGIWLAVALIMVIVFKIQLSVCLMTGALGMIITRVLSIDEAYQAVDWRTVFLLGGLIPLGIATEKTGTAAWIAHTVLNAIGTVEPIVLLAVIGVLATVFTLVISNVGATVLLVPLVVNMALAAHTDPRMAALVVGLATSNSFILPTHQVNALYMGPGRYRSVDFMKAGTVVSIVFLVVMIAMLYLFY